MSITREPGEPKHVRNVNPALAAPFSNHVGNSTSDDRQRSDDSHELSRIVCELAAMDHGYLKVKRATDSTGVHLTWTWTLTRHRGSYVYVKVEGHQLLLGLQLLARKIQEVDQGERVPTVDKRRQS